MNVSLTPQLEKMVRDKVESGMYNNASEVVRDALRMMAAKDRHADSRASLDRAREQSARGEGTIWTDQTMDEILREADEADGRGEPIRADVQPYCHSAARCEDRFAGYLPVHSPGMGLAPIHYLHATAAER